MSFCVFSDIRTWAEIDLGAIRHNLAVVRRLIGPEPGLIAIVKANGYGHGAVEVARAIAAEVAIFGVANVVEAQALRAAGLGHDILLLSPCLPEERPAAVAGAFIVTVSSAEEAGAFAAIGGPVRINFKIDTGMGRIGAWQDDAIGELKAILPLKNCELHSVSTHLPVADEDDGFSRSQLDHFEVMTGAIRKLFPDVKVHVHNSAGILCHPERKHDFVRPGLMLYGSAYPGEYQSLLRQAMTWKARVVLVRDVEAGRSTSYGRTFITPRRMRLATLPVGYADGYPRQVSGKGAQVLIDGRRCDVLGRVTMDQIVVDVSEVPGVVPGTEAVLTGYQQGAFLPARELADWAGTIAWDIFTGVKSRVAKFYDLPL